MTVTEDRAAVVKLLKSRGAKLRRGHLRLPVGELFWYVDARADGIGPHASLRLEVGCWPPSLPEPEGGAVDCALLLELPLGEDPVSESGRILDLVGGIGDLPSLARRLDELPGALVDRALRDLL